MNTKCSGNCGKFDVSDLLRRRVFNFIWGIRKLERQVLSSGDRFRQAEAKASQLELRERFGRNDVDYDH